MLPNLKQRIPKFGYFEPKQSEQKETRVLILWQTRPHASHSLVLLIGRRLKL